MKRLLSVIPLIVFAAIVAVGGFVLMNGGARNDFGRAGLIGRPIPAYALEKLGAAGSITPAAFAGRPYIVNVFASWCAPCRIEHPNLMRLAQEGVPILGIAYKDKPQATAAMLAELGHPFAVVGMDPNGRYGLDIGVTGVPETFLVDSEGRIRLIHRGPVDDAALAAKIRPMLKAMAEGR
jgi:cytochrome c biogenesis protein CcmG/thiol:disulfide interchange protein DsbE